MGRKAIEVKVEGLVQGVGFRPFVHRLAKFHGLSGWVKNAPDGVYMRLQGVEGALDVFLEEMKTKAPAAASIEKVSIDIAALGGSGEFIILASERQSGEITQVSPDIATCTECLADMQIQPRRLDYPFTNCTHCGPRFSIVNALPYDRVHTTMDVFPLCKSCKTEYSDLTDRRFHAQPVACNTCGPRYELHYHGQTITILADILAHVASILHAGGIVAVKGLGGFFLACDACNEEVVKRLRSAKIREGKPFAVMFRDKEVLKKYALSSDEEDALLSGWQRPIVILSSRDALAPSVSAGFPTVGAMLPYMPFHHLLFRELSLDALVMTSGNLSEEPIMIDNDEAESVLSGISDAVLAYNRNIHNRVDDSVTFVVNRQPRLIRRSRGYAPAPVFTRLNTEGIFAAGAELNNCFCLGKGRQAILSQHIGDLKNFETYAFYTEAVDRFCTLFRLSPNLAACDLHPDYLSSNFARQMGIPVKEVQHHHAHIAACITEHGLEGQVIGVALDGTGYGTDGTIWGSEFMIAGLAGFERVWHFGDIPLPGGDSVTREPWRTGLSLLADIYKNDLAQVEIPFLQQMDPEKKSLVLESIEKKVNCPLSCSAGRWFDAVAAITGLCAESTFHSEAPMRLETVIDHRETGAYPWHYSEGGVISLAPAIRMIVDDILHKLPVPSISARFHNTILDLIHQTVLGIADQTGLRKLVVSGGTFQNKYLLSAVETLFAKENIEVYTHIKVPSNDAGISLGQLAIAAASR